MTVSQVRCRSEFGKGEVKRASASASDFSQIAIDGGTGPIRRPARREGPMSYAKLSTLMPFSNFPRISAPVMMRGDLSQISTAS